ncbi:ROK family protein [Flavobacteriaceae bacterium]|nr:ROK family protein [Flavobacteriaceae bacterium]
MNKDFALGIDIGGSHLAIAIVDISHKNIVNDTKIHVDIDSQQDALTILTTMVNGIKACIQKFNKPIQGIGLSIPGPLDYDKGISKIFNCNKYDYLFGVDIKTYLYNHLNEYINAPSEIVFVNDANCFLLGEAWKNSLNGSNVTGITLGTGIGSGFITGGAIVKQANNVPPKGQVYNLPFKGKRAEDWLGTNWFLEEYKSVFSNTAENVKVIAEQAQKSPKAKRIFEDFGTNLGSFLAPVLKDFSADHLIIGGNIAKSYNLFKDIFEACFNGMLPTVIISEDTENSAILGSVQKLISNCSTQLRHRRETAQFLMPINEQPNEEKEGYEVFPSYKVNQGTIHQGFKSLAKEIASEKAVVIDGYLGVYWDDFMLQLTEELHKLGVNNITYSIDTALKSVSEIDTLIEPFLGGDDAVFGKVFEGGLSDFYDSEKLNSIKKDNNALSILFGSGATLANWDAKVLYVDIPKNEIQYRSRSGNILNLGAEEVLPPKPQYKRMFFIDWIALNKHKAAILNKIDYIIDGQYFDDLSWCTGATLRQGLNDMSKTVFRARPWFEAGVWGGHWMKNKIEGLSQDVVNYAWSFELIVPENGVVFSDNDTRLEVSFDMLMFNDNKAILGDASETFGYEFPIRFDYLDTYYGANLSLQCHPTQEFIRENFGEKFTQDETYYILDAEDGAQVYLGFKDGIKPEDFHNALKESNAKAEVMDVEKYIQKHDAKKHDLFLIPNGTIHCSGRDNLVLEISSTPYIYTFKMYDWMRLDLDGNPRPLNIERGMQVVNFDCQGEKVKDEYFSKESIIDSGEDYKALQLSTHPKHFYEIFRYEFHNKMEVKTNNQCHILNLVEGSKIKVIAGDRSMVIKYAETFVIPAKAESYTIINLGDTEAKVIQSNVKPEFCNTRF